MSNNYITDVQIKTSGDKVEVTISAMSFDDYRCREKVTITLREVRSILEEKKVKVGKCIQNPILQNKRRTTVTWVFEKPARSVTTTRKQTSKTSSRRKNSKKVQKNLDNTPKDVIILETNKSETCHTYLFLN